MASLCGFAALQLRLEFHYTEESKRGEGGVDRWIVGGKEEATAPGDKGYGKLYTVVIRGNWEKQAEKKLVADRCK